MQPFLTKPEVSRPGLAVLLVGAASARAANAPLDHFAVELAQVEAVGLSRVQLRWLLASRLARHLKETTIAGAKMRTFEAAGSYVIDATSCFVLTPEGVAFALDRVHADEPRTPRRPRSSGRPAWDEARRELRLGRLVVKRYRVPADNQVLILRVFEESGWPRRIDDPLPPADGIDARRRLQATIASLNRKRMARGLRFAGDGTGRGVVWEREFQSGA